MKKRYIFMAGMGLFLGGFYLGGKMLVSMINDYRERMKRNLSNMMLFHDWLAYLYAGGRIERYFVDHGYKKIMIYGNGYIGQRLMQALEGTGIEVVAVMDKAAAEAEEIVIGVDAAIPDVDCIIVTPVFFYDAIYDMLREKTDIPIISMQSVIEENG
ncbi:MAG: hypothetical protein NC548_25890 [Lachnospiraceae bacterium]|nr:hypothetical protein [Lachnospiraceae bacterium]